MQPYVILSLGSGLLYGISGLLVKRAMDEGVGVWRLSFYSNLAQTVLYLPLPLVLTGGKWPQNAGVHQLLLPAAAFLVGMLFTTFAIRKGDISIATPLLGSKVVFVSLLAAAVLRAELTRAVWAGAFLVFLGLALLRGGGGKGGSHFWLTVFYSLAGAFSFAACDIMFQSWAPAWGAGWFIPGMFVGVTVMSLFIFPLLEGRLFDLNRRQVGWLLPAVTLNALQSLGISLSLACWGHAAEVNILYSSRGVWMVVMVWLIGKWFGCHEKDHGRKTMLLRLGGATLIILAIVFVIRSH
jgi:drug/metabolite transporter (DMT)-like permease